MQQLGLLTLASLYHYINRFIFNDYIALKLNVGRNVNKCFLWKKEYRRTFVPLNC